MSEPTVAQLASHIREVTAVRPGDVLVMKLAPTVDPDETRRLLDQLRAAAPNLNVLIVGGDIQLTVMRADTPTPTVAERSPEDYGA
jgi:hypothetical protein